MARFLNDSSANLYQFKLEDQKFKILIAIIILTSKEISLKYSKGNDKTIKVVYCKNKLSYPCS